MSYKFKVGDRIFLSYSVCEAMSIPKKYGNRIAYIASIINKRSIFTECGWGIYAEHVIPVTPLLEALC